ncbi:MAG: hypothetical protein IJM58_02450 [Muribaculaceae bacterium]|nr:hypothetical protein [Muribaculaceae bacterium]
MNRYRIIDFIRKTHSVEECRAYEEIYERDDVHEFALMMQRKNLISFLKYLRTNVFFAGFLQDVDEAIIENSPYDVIKLLPITDKDLIRDHFDLIHNVCYRGESNYTGGSTGSPFHYIVDKQSLSKTIGYTLSSWRVFGNYDFEDNVLVVGGSSLGDKESLKKAVLHYLQRRTYVSGGEITLNNAIRFADIINEARKQIVLYGYPSSICEYVNILNDKGISINIDNIKSVLTTSETLSLDRREHLQSFFRKKVVNLYGARDGGISAVSINDEEFYYNGCDCFVENIEFDGNNELVVTNLFSHAFPFVRYRIGDVADVSTCLNGYPFKLSNLLGRTRDFIKIADGGRVHGSLINKILKPYPIVEYQIVQHSDTSCDISLVASHDFNHDAVEDDFFNVLASLVLRFHYVDSIPRLKNNKLRNIISEL